MILKFNQLNENKMWYKTIPEMLDYIASKNIPWVILDTETTGLLGSKEEQLTQVSAIVSKYDLISNKFEELSQFDEKIKLTQKIIDTLNRMTLLEEY
jgi:DNA polymerase III epsilon subunit-like protein